MANGRRGSTGATATSGPPGRQRSAAEQVAAVVTAPLEFAQRVMPDSALPVYLGAGALVVAGVIEWPVFGAVGLGYAALRRWHPAAARQPRG